MIYIFLIAIAILSIYYIFFHNGRIRKYVDKIPGPPRFPLLGNLLYFNVPNEKLWDVVRKLTREYYPVGSILLGFRHAFISIGHPDDLELVLTSQKYINKGMSYSYFHPWLKTGLLTSGDQKWRIRRKMLTPTFHFNILKKYMEITNENGIKFVEALKSEGPESVQNITSLTSKYTLNIILESAMGIDLDKVDKKTADNYRNAVYDIGKIIIYRIARPYIFNWMLSPLTQLGRLQKQVLQTLSGFTQQIIKDRREYNKTTGFECVNSLTDDEQTQDDIVLKGGKKRLAMLDLLLSAEKDGLIDSEGIEEEVNTFTFEGHDTTAMAMAFTLMLLAENKKIQDEVRAEVTEMFDRSGGRIGMIELQELNYLERCIKESLRLYPPVATMSRYVSEDLRLKTNNYLVPAGTEVIYHLYDTHRDPNFWEDPEKFDPDRFLPERIQGRHPYSYIPFSAGPRNCIGQKFALMELKSLLARILYDFKLEPVDRLSEMKLLLDIILRPNAPFHSKFIRINHESENLC